VNQVAAYVLAKNAEALGISREDVLNRGEGEDQSQEREEGEEGGTGSGS
jgi:hypothetical protein